MHSSFNRSVLREVARFDWVRLNYSLLTIFFAIFERTDVADLICLVNKDAEAMRGEFTRSLDVRTPENVVYKWTIRHLVFSEILGFSHLFVLCVKFDIESEWLVFVSAELSVLICSD